MKYSHNFSENDIEVIEYIENKGFNFHLGSAVKYISRAGHEDPSKYIEDLKKAVFYIEREIAHHQAIRNAVSVDHGEKKLQEQSDSTDPTCQAITGAALYQKSPVQEIKERDKEFEKSNDNWKYWNTLKDKTWASLK